MNARELMSHNVATVAPDTPLREVARSLLANQMSAIPVVDASGNLVGMVSEGDLVGRKKTERETRSEWWLQRLAEGETLNTEFLEHLQSPLAVASEVMSSPVVTVDESTDMDEIASLMATHNVKRIPVMHDGKIVGIIRRSDLLRVFGGGAQAPVPLPPNPEDTAFVVPPKTDGHAASVITPAPLGPVETESASDFKHLVAHHHEVLAEQQRQAKDAVVAQRRHDLLHVMATHVSDALWHHILKEAHDAAINGDTEHLMLRFPSELCSDGGRAINMPDPEWPRTLRGEPAEVYLRWERDLRPRGFHIAARIMNFPDGFPGDVGLYLVWSE
ncbi:MAG TPA: CBS domain-containing protein [Bauldia sp.]|nr:CBS domain-containing protein [Bauldia sp.]